MEVHRSVEMMYIRAHLADKLVIKITPCRCMCRAGSSQGQLLYVEGEFSSRTKKIHLNMNMVRTLAICLPSPHSDELASISIKKIRGSYTQTVRDNDAVGSSVGNEVEDLYWSRHDLFRFCAIDEVCWEP